MKNKKTMPVLMAGCMMMGSIIPAFAATGNDTDSIGSVAEDFTNKPKTGQDKVQDKQSEYSPEITSDTAKNNCEAYLTKASTFSVVIPKKIILDGSKTENNSGAYSVTVKANMGGDDIISVIPDAGFNFRQPGKKDVAATVSQPKTTFQINDGLVTEENVESGNTTTGTVSVAKITSGKWSGNFNFSIAINTGTAIVK